MDVAGGVIQYDFGKTIKEGRFIHTGSLNKPPTILRTAVTKLRARIWRKGSQVQSFVDMMIDANPLMKQDFEYPGLESDQLFRVDFNHIDGERDCEQCEATN